MTNTITGSADDTVKVTVDSNQSWLTPLNKLRIQAHVILRKPEVELRDGRVLLLTYDKPKTGFFTVQPHPDKLRPGDSEFIPMGHFKISTVSHEQWLESGSLNDSVFDEPNTLSESLQKHDSRKRGT